MPPCIVCCICKPEVRRSVRDEAIFKSTQREMFTDLVIKDNCILRVIMTIISDINKAHKCARKSIRAISNTKLKKKVICIEIRNTHCRVCLVCISVTWSLCTVIVSAVASSLRVGVQVSQPHGDSLLMSPEITGQLLRILIGRLKPASSKLKKRDLAPSPFFLHLISASILLGNTSRHLPFISVTHARNMAKPKPCK